MSNTKAESRGGGDGKGRGGEGRGGEAVPFSLPLSTCHHPLLISFRHSSPWNHTRTVTEHILQMLREDLHIFLHLSHCFRRHALDPRMCSACCVMHWTLSKECAIVLVSVERGSCSRGASCVVEYTMGKLRDWSL